MAPRRALRSFSAKARDRLADDARHLHRMWSFRLAILAAILSGLEVAWPLLHNLFLVGAVPNGVFGAVSAGLAVLAAIARVIRQQFPPS